MSSNLLAQAWEAAAAEFDPKPDTSNMTLWAKNKLDEYLWSKQREIAESLKVNRYTAVQSCHGAGKSFVGSRAVAHWIDTHDPGDAFVVTTAPTAAQVSAILWREIQKAHVKGNLPGSITTAGYPQWKLSGGRLVGYGRKPADYSDDAFQGIHERYVLVVMDEGGGIDKNLFDAADALATNRHARVLVIGNPDDPTSHFAQVCKPDSGWNVIRIDGLRSPNMTQRQIMALVDPRTPHQEACKQCRDIGATEPLVARLMREEGINFADEVIPEGMRDMLLDPLWVEERLHRWVGRVTPEQSLSEMAGQSSLWTSKVRGLFPDSNSEGVIPLGWVEAAIQRYKNWEEKGKPPLAGQDVIGADIASTGKDNTCLALRTGAFIRELRVSPESDTMVTTGHINAALTADALAVVDSIGVGAGVLDRLREQGINVLGFVASGSAKGYKDRSGEFGFQNMRSYAWWNLRELLDPSRGAIVALPDDEILKADLTAPRWTVGSNAIIKVEGKDDIRKRLGRSTDKGDAVVQAFVNELDLLNDGTEGGVVPWDSPDAAAGVVPWHGKDDEWQ